MFLQNCVLIYGSVIKEQKHLTLNNNLNIIIQRSLFIVLAKFYCKTSELNASYFMLIFICTISATAASRKLSTHLVPVFLAVPLLSGTVCIKQLV